MAHYDIVHAADPRFRGGTGSAIRTEIIAAHRWGIKAALLPYLGVKERPASGFVPRIQAAIEALDFPLLSREDPATCDILFAHHPYVFEFMPLQAPKLRPKRVVAVLHHPPVDGRHVAQYDIEKLIETLELSFRAPVMLAPVGPIVRHQLLELGYPEDLIVAHDLLNVIDEMDWPKRDRSAPKDHVVIGRHSRNDPLKWPDTIAEFEAAYPSTPEFSLRVLGDAFIPEGISRPQNLHMRPFSETGVAEFLNGLDFYVYFHSEKWTEAFGIAIAEAMATGLVVILPHYFRQTFGDAAVYCTPEEVQAVIRRFIEQPDEYRRQSRAARRIALNRFGMPAYGQRLLQLYTDLDLPNAPAIQFDPGEPVSYEPSAPKFPRGPARTRVLMVATNGIGLGHVTRLMAIAKHLPDWIEPVFLTLSLATEIIRKEGYAADYIPSFGKSGVTEASWNEVFSVELMAALEATGAQGVIFDSNYPFPGLLTVLNRRPDISWTWIRRAMWQPHQVRSDTLEKHFDLLIEPQELAMRHDGGATTKSTGAMKVGPVLLVEPGEELSRTEAANALNLDPKQTNVAIQLGSRQNIDLRHIRKQLETALATHNIDAFEIINPLAPADDDLELPQRAIYPIAKYARALDLLITTAGYNGFHESMYHGIPSLFIPNEAPEMDHQHLRAHVAKVAGAAEVIRSSEARSVPEVISRCLSETFRTEAREAASAFEFTSGARQAAVAISEQLCSIRANRPISLALPRSR